MRRSARAGSELIAATVLATLLLQLVLRLLRSCLGRDLKRDVFRFAIRLPVVRGFAEQETQKETGQLWDKYHSRRQDSMQTLPKVGLSKEEILTRLQKGEAASRKWYIEGGARLSGAVYSADPAHWDLVSSTEIPPALQQAQIGSSVESPGSGEDFPVADHAEYFHSQLFPGCFVSRFPA